MGKEHAFMFSTHSTEAITVVPLDMDVKARHAQAMATIAMANATSSKNVSGDNDVATITTVGGCEIYKMRRRCRIIVAATASEPTDLVWKSEGSSLGCTFVYPVEVHAGVGGECGTCHVPPGLAGHRAPVLVAAAIKNEVWHDVDISVEV